MMLASTSRARELHHAATRDGTAHADEAELGTSLIFEYVLHSLEQERAATAKLVAIVKARGQA